MSQNVPEVGKVIPEGKNVFRDAIHVPVAPMVAGEVLCPGNFVRIENDEALICKFDQAIGVVDPFLNQIIMKGQKFWIFIFPNTVTSLRHAWSLPGLNIRTKQLEVPPLPEDEEKPKDE